MLYDFNLYLLNRALSCVSDGQAIAVKLSKQITQRTNSIKTTIAKYNASLKSLEDWIEGLPRKIEFDEAKDPRSQLYCDFNFQTNKDTVPFTAKRSAIELHNFLERCKEEQEMLEMETERLVQYYLDKKQELESYINVNGEVQSKILRGTVANFKKDLININNALYSLKHMLNDYLTEASKSKLPFFKIEAEHALSILRPTNIIEDTLEIETSSVDNETDCESLLQFSDFESDTELE